MRIAPTFLIVLLYCLSTHGEELQMACSPKNQAGDCFDVHARLFMVENGIIFRMWPVGTKRNYGIDNDALPPLIDKYLDINTDIYGDFVVCPHTKERAAFLRWVCIKSAKHLVVDSLDPNTNTSKTFRLLRTW